MQGSCALTHQNKHFIYGGGISTGKQVLEVTDCGLTSFGSLDFKHSNGACSSSNGVIVCALIHGITIRVDERHRRLARGN